ncbi:MAG: heat-inducible transcription repressor HrcA [Peptostreptococcaceae bacterium]|nr:heat-inducible transcription repressor HrcA [Peptostreptococcaceae bacterium]
MQLTERQLRIFQAIVDDFIETAQPVGSRTLSRKFDLGVSSATIRNEMSDLEELGFIEQLHTSSGRIPSDKGYRLYVDSLMRLYKMANINKKSIRDQLISRMLESEEIIRQASKILSQMSDLTAFIMTPDFKASRLKNLKLVRLGDKRALLVLVSESGIVKDLIVGINNLSQDELDKISNMLKYRLKGKDVNRLNKGEILRVENSFENYLGFVDNLIDSIGTHMNRDTANRIHMSGISNVLHTPEFSDVEKAKCILDALDKKDKLLIVLREDLEKDISVRIGKENQWDEIKECSLVTATYKLNGRVIGKIGVIGPTRINYPKIISLVEYMTDTLTEVFSGQNQINEEVNGDEG